MLAQMAVLDPASFSKVAELASQLKDEGGKQRIIFPCFFLLFFFSFASSARVKRNSRAGYITVIKDNLRPLGFRDATENCKD